MLALAVRDTGRGILVGHEASAGRAAKPGSIRLYWSAAVTFPEVPVRRLDGSYLHGRGIPPDHLVPWTVEALRRGEDNAVAAAERILLAGR